MFKFYQIVQTTTDGLARAFVIGEKFIGKDNVAMVLGDNIFAGHGLKKRLRKAVENAESGNVNPCPKISTCKLPFARYILFKSVISYSPRAESFKFFAYSMTYERGY